jgi:gas vesicle protein
MSDKESGNGFLLGFLLGALAGVAVGFLYAPKPGKETRALLKEKASEFKEKAGEVINRVTGNQDKD